jgi:hypothetical protein
MSYNFYHNLPEIARNGGFKLGEEEEGNSSHIDWRFIGKQPHAYLYTSFLALSWCYLIFQRLQTHIKSSKSRILKRLTSAFHFSLSHR